MKTFSQFHDGWLDGLLISDSSAHLFLSTEDRKSFVLEVDGVLSLQADGFRAGNIIFDVLVREDDEVNSEDVFHLYGFTDQEKALAKFESLRKGKLLVVEVNPSYGAACRILAASVNLISRDAWTDSLLISRRVPHSSPPLA
jgi:hypothetical protein